MMKSILLSVSLLDGPQLDLKTTDQYDRMARFFLRQRLVDQTARALALFDIPTLVRPATSETGPIYPYVISQDDASLDDLLSKQDSYFREVGITSGDNFLAIPFLGGKIQFNIENLDQAVTGSYFSKFRASITIESAKHFSRDLFIAVVAHLLVSTAFGHVPRHVELPPPPPVHYVCTVDGSIPGDPESLISEATNDLGLSQQSAPTRIKEVWKSRQLCLKAAGFDPGAIDGVRGVATIRAEQRFEHFYSVKVNWNSKVFQRYIVKLAQDHSADVCRGHQENHGLR
ncbi:hypothetical protein ACKWRH_35545 [Bradyrhizobium sp. Pa8]|uniref:hypothetical protein n=1 Tax=Bradyrhizobium sp. Pa8 TaxID=3386552 RepID=UPI00403F594B